PPRSPGNPLSLTLAHGTPLLLPASSLGTVAEHYQWSFNGVDLPAKTNMTLKLDSLTFSDAGTYSVVLSNRFGSATNSYTITVAPLLITSPPASQTVFGGSTVTFEVTALGTGLNYQWQFNGTNIDAATNSSLLLANVLPEQAGAYSVTVTNDIGAITA